MQGFELLKKCPQNIKDIIVRNFRSLDNFYAFVYQIGVNQFEIYKRTHINDYTEENRIIDYLEKEGVDPLLADDIVKEIIGDYDEVLATDYAKAMLGPNWKELLENFDKMINA